MSKVKKSAPEPKSASGVKSAIRVFKVLELFDQLRVPLTVSDISRELELPLSSTLMLLRSMTDHGYLTNEETRKCYFPTPRLSELTSWVDFTATGVENVTFLLDDLSRATGETIVLAAEQSLEVVFLRILPSKHPLSLSIEVGNRTPIESSAVGLAAMSAKTDEELQALFDRLADIPDRALSDTEKKKLLRTVRKTRKQGVAIGYGLMSPDIGAIAAPLPAGKSNVTYVVSIGGPRNRIANNEATITAALKKHIARLEKARRVS